MATTKNISQQTGSRGYGVAVTGTRPGYGVAVTSTRPDVTTRQLTIKKGNILEAMGGLFSDRQESGFMRKLAKQPGKTKRMKIKEKHIIRRHKYLTWFSQST